MENNKVLAKVGSREITQHDVNFFMQSLNPQTASQFQTEAGQKQLLDELISQELFYLDAKAKGMDQNDLYLKEVERLKDSLLKQFALNQLLGNLQVTDAEITAYYEENKDQFMSPKSIKASHILVKEKDEATKIAKELQEGLSFEEAAQKYSTCPSSASGGDLGFFGRGVMVPEFEEVAFALELNKISEPVQSQFGYHIIKITDSKQENTKTLIDVKDQIKQQILAKKQQLVYADKVTQLKEVYPIVML